MKTDLLNQFKTTAENAIQNLSIEDSLSNSLHYLCVLEGCYTGLDQEKEDWALKLAANLLEAEKRQIVIKLITERTTMPAEQFVVEVK